MNQVQINCGLDCPNIPNLFDGLAYIEQCHYTFLCMPIVHPRLRRKYNPGGGATMTSFTRSDMILDTGEWGNRIIARTSPYLTVETSNLAVRQQHEDCLVEELNYCKGLGISVAVINLHGPNNNNLARIITSHLNNNSHYSLGFWIQVPMNNPHLSTFGEQPDDEKHDDTKSTWHWWSNFHKLTEWDKKVSVVLKLSADLPSEEDIKRWLGEPIKCLVIPTDVFLTNKKKHPTLSRPHQAFVKRLLDRDVQLMVTGTCRHMEMKHYVKYLQYIWNTAPSEDAMINYAKGWEDYLQTPLQPLSDNLDSYTYNVFEKDPIKYDYYQNAVLEALQSRYKEPLPCICGKRRKINEIKLPLINDDLACNKPEIIEEELKEANEECKEEIKDEPRNETKVEVKEEPKEELCICKHSSVVMVLGAGRGPLVRAVLNASKMANVDVKVYAVEKNPTALVTLHGQQRELWGDKVTVIANDMRKFKPDQLADIIVSELLGSFGDNELSPECLDGARHLLKDDGISIPCSYTSYISPVMCPRLWGFARANETVQMKGAFSHPLETPWVVYQQNRYEISPPQELFTFIHPCEPGDGSHVERRRWKALKFPVSRACTLHGFSGYFDSILYNEHCLSIVPATHSPSMISWFPIYFPIKSPITLKADDIIEVNFWRCSDARKVWYEWNVVSPELQTIHNSCGKSSNMIL